MELSFWRLDVVTGRVSLDSDLGLGFGLGLGLGFGLAWDESRITT